MKNTIVFPLSAAAGLSFVLSGLLPFPPALAQINTQVNKRDFAIRIVDEDMADDKLQGPVDDERVRMAQPGGGALWLKREGGIDGNALADASVRSDHGKLVIEFRLTPTGRNQFAAMTRENLGHRLAIVVNDTVIIAPNVFEPIVGGTIYITDAFSTQAQANTLVAEALGTNHSSNP